MHRDTKVGRFFSVAIFQDCRVRVFRPPFATSAGCVRTLPTCDIRPSVESTGGKIRGEGEFLQKTKLDFSGVGGALHKSQPLHKNPTAKVSLHKNSLESRHEGQATRKAEESVRRGCHVVLCRRSRGRICDARADRQDLSAADSSTRASLASTDASRHSGRSRRGRRGPYLMAISPSQPALS